MEVFAQYATGTGNTPDIVGNLTAAVAASFGWVSTAPETNYIFDFFDDVLGGSNRNGVIFEVFSLFSKFLIPGIFLM